jgi:hypothetical protein
MSENLRRLTVVHPNGSTKTTIEAPPDIPMERLVPAVAGRLGLPSVDQSGQAVEYRLSYRRDEQEHVLNAQDTFATADLQDGDVVRLTTDMRAGARVKA